MKESPTVAATIASPMAPRIVVTPARPLSPSITFTACVTPVTANTVKRKAKACTTRMSSTTGISSPVRRASSSTKPSAAPSAGSARRGMTKPRFEISSIRPQTNAGATQTISSNHGVSRPFIAQSIAAPPTTPRATATPPMRGVGIACTLRRPPYVSSSVSRRRCEPLTSTRAPMHANAAAITAAKTTATLGKAAPQHVVFFCCCSLDGNRQTRFPMIDRPWPLSIDADDYRLRPTKCEHPAAPQSGGDVYSALATRDPRRVCRYSSRLIICAGSRNKKSQTRSVAGEDRMSEGFWGRAAALLVGAALCWSALAQESGGPGIPLAPAIAPAGAAPASAPTTTPVQTPTIINQPQPPAAPAPTRPASRAEEPARSAEAQAIDRNDFQEFIAQSSGQTLPLYGYNLFQGTPSTFAPVEKVPVAGVPYKDITRHIRTAVARNFRNFELMVTMGQLRSIQIFVVGQARRPGAYTVSSLSTLINAIFAVGGPSTRGSMRNIQLKRGNSVVAELDLYDLVALGDKSRDVQLLPGDVIYFAPIGSLVALAGSVNNPAIFELKRPATVGQLIELAGGLTTTAQTRRASIERIDERQTRTVDQFSLDYDGLRRPLKDGDLVSVYSISPRFENAVTLRGKVAAPLRYPYKPGMRVRDLIPEREALITADYYARKNLSVLSNQVVQGKLAYDVRRLADEINWDYAVIERLERNELTTTLIPFNLGKALLEDDANNLPLVPGDIVTIFSKTDVGAPVGRRPVVVSLEGEFNAAGVYQARPKETLRQLIGRVGGVTPKAYVFGTEFTRESTRREQEERLKAAVDQLEQELQRASITRARNVVSAEDAASLKQEAEAQRSLVLRLRTLKPTGRLVFNVAEKAAIADLPDIELEDGDRIMLPQSPSQVSVFGTVFNESSFVYDPGHNVGDYLKLAGGPRKQADRSSIYLLRANGSVVSARQAGWFSTSINSEKIMPGDAIVVPEDFERVTWLRALKDWTQVFYQFGLGAAAIKVLSD